MVRSSSALCAFVLPFISLAQGGFQQTCDWDYQGTAVGGTPSALLKVADGYLLGGTAFGSLFGVGLLRTDEAGVPVWNTSYDITGDGFGEGNISDLLALPDGGFIVAGAAPELFYARVDAAGAMLWAKRIQGTYNFATGLTLLSDGQLLFTGKRQGNAYDAFVIKADLDGTVLWSQFYGTTAEDSEFFTSVVETPDNGFLCLGYRNHQTQYMDLLLTKLDANGAVEWSKRYGASEVFIWLYSGDLCATADGNYVLTASSFVSLPALNPDNLAEPLMLKVDPTGTVLWSKKYTAVPTLGGLGITNDLVRDRILPDGSMMLVLSSVVGSSGMQLVHTDAVGVPLSTNNLRNGTSPSYVKDMVLLPDGSVALTGFNNPGTYVASSFLARTDVLGHTACNDTASTVAATTFELPTSPGDVVASPCTFTYTDLAPATTALAVDVHNACSGTGVNDLAAAPLPTLTLRPNPASTNVQVRMEGLPAGSSSTVVLLDATGAVVRTLPLGGSGTGRLNVQDLAPGIYLVRWHGAEGAVRTKLLVVSAG